MDLKDRVAIVTGGALGIGRAISLRLTREGADVVVADLDSAQANNVIDEIRELGHRAMAVRVDVTKSTEVNQLVKTARDEFGKIDILVNNAGGTARERKLFHESTEEAWDYVLATNLKGTVNCTRAVINHMIERRKGRIVSIASVAGMIGKAELTDYAAAKGGIISFTMSLAKEVSSYGINVNCVSPGPVQTRLMDKLSHDAIEAMSKLTGFGRWGKPEEIASMVAFLVSDEANFITGQNFAVCGLRNLGGP
jgi:NAD(P)-dependent dehydrogenase (short-subunit alcohol dehydrogenase family)